MTSTTQSNSARDSCDETAEAVRRICHATIAVHDGVFMRRTERGDDMGHLMTDTGRELSVDDITTLA
jgi:hypothetical protein